MAGEAQALGITAHWGRYERIRVEDEAHPRRAADVLPAAWRRVPREAVSEAIPPKGGGMAEWLPSLGENPPSRCRG